ncbi:MAG: hypothetical protein IJK53_00685 [Erysipelotrichaceae bacterium]|nr:hypothetical protein [Erysipelotrichaceae bacterium]
MKAQEKAHAIKQIFVLSLAHMGIDFLCAFSLYRSFVNIADVFLLYNFCAFALQLPIGLIVDLWNEKRKEKNKIAVYTTVMGVALTILGSYVSPIISGLGNALFHSGGGILSMNEDEKNDLHSKGLGVFVAPGAIGLFLGMWFYQSSFYRVIQGLVSLALLGLALLVFLQTKEEKQYRRLKLPEDFKGWLKVSLCFLVVFLRSLNGMAVTFSWKQGFVLSFLSVLALALGKCAGGFINARIKEKKTIWITLCLSALLYSFGDHVVCGLLALFFFNMSMPLTLYLLAKQIKGGPGFAFGLLTFSLFLGYLPVLYGLIGKTGPFPLGSITSLLSLILLVTYLRMAKDE